MPRLECAGQYVDALAQLQLCLASRLQICNGMNVAGPSSGLVSPTSSNSPPSSHGGRLYLQTLLHWLGVFCNKYGSKYLREDKFSMAYTLLYVCPVRSRHYIYTYLNTILSGHP